MAPMHVRGRSRTLQPRVTLLALSLAGALSACGGGGGGTRADPPPQAPPPTPPTPPPTVVEPPNPAYSGHLLLTGADEAHDAGLTGKGVRIGVLDSGINRNHPALKGRVVANLAYINPNTNNLTVDDVVGHGTAVAQIIAGTPFGQWPGGIAPGAELVSARIISDKPPDDDGSGKGNEINGPLGLAPIHQDLIVRGVRIMNNSWGGLYWTNLSVTAQIAAEYRPFINNGGLVVFSTGNSGFDDPSDTAALPSKPGTGGSMPAADLERGWLAVAALDGDNPNLLAEYSNACGVAMHYCLAAPGTVIVTGTNDAPDRPQYWRWRGTSFSAPIVSGAAALVWEAFPWFTNDQVRQTLLGTATDLGAPGVDPVFGYGAVNIADAVKGPAKLDWGDFVARFNAGTYVFSNNLGGPGALVKEGNGTLVLEADAANAGGLEVRGGVLQAGGEVSGNVTIRTGGTYRFGAESQVHGGMDNAGRLELVPMGGPGRWYSVVDGDYRHRNGATLALHLGQALAVGGHATIDGGQVEVMGVAQGYTTQSREILLAAGQLTGRFDGLASAPSLFLEGTLGYGADEGGDRQLVWLDITRLDVASAAKAMARMSPAALSAAERVEQAFDGIDRRQGGGGGDAVSGDFLRVAGEFQRIADERQARAALESLSGESHALATTLTFDAIDMARRALSSHIGDADLPAGAYTWKQALGYGGGMTGFSTGGHALEGWMVGNDTRLGGGIAGFAFGETRLHDHLGANHDRSRDRQIQAQFYAGGRRGEAYAMARLGFGRFDRNVERHLFDGEDARRGVAGRYGGGFSSVAFEAGRRHRAGGAALTAYAGAEHARLRSKAFREWGDTGFALEVQAADMRRTQAYAGVRAEFGLAGMAWRAYGEWQQVVSADGFDVMASFTGIDSWSPLPLPDAAKSGGLFGVGFDAWTGREARLSFGLDQRFGPRGHERMASLRYVLGF